MMQKDIEIMFEELKIRVIILEKQLKMVLDCPIIKKEIKENTENFIKDKLGMVKVSKDTYEPKEQAEKRLKQSVQYFIQCAECAKRMEVKEKLPNKKYLCSDCAAKYSTAKEVKKEEIDIKEGDNIDQPIL